MDPRLLSYYNQELQHLRDMGREFAQEYPKVANRLSLDGFECQDPYVERLLESFAFLAARVQLKLDAEFPRFTQHLLETIYPHFLSPTPSMAVMQFTPESPDAVPPEGQVIPIGAALRSKTGKGDATACEYRTAHETSLWPLSLVAAEYLPRGARALSGVGQIDGVRAGVRLTLETPEGIPFNSLELSRLPLFLQGADQIPMQLYELLIGHTVEVICKESFKKRSGWEMRLGRRGIRQMGFSEEEALLPYTVRSFQGYRLLQEYFAFPQRFLFVALDGLGECVKRCGGNRLEVLLLLDQTMEGFEDILKPSNFALFASPAINLFPKRADRVHLDSELPEFHIVPDRTRPMDFEVFQVTEVLGMGSSKEIEQPFYPFYAARDFQGEPQGNAYYALNRKPRLLSSKQKRQGPRSDYIGTELFISLVDASEAPYSHNLKQLAIKTLCTNRDLTLHIPLGQGDTDFYLTSGEEVRSVRCIAGPTKPRPSPAYHDGETAWRLINHLSLNYLSLSDAGEEEGARALREYLKLYSDAHDLASQRQIEGVNAIRSRMVTRRLPMEGPIVFGRGVEVLLEMDEAAFEGTGVFLLGAVLERFFAGYASINTFTETRVRTSKRGEIMKWPIRSGQRARL